MGCVDFQGEFVECQDDCLEVTHGPISGNMWFCKDCGADAIVTESS